MKQLEPKEIIAILVIVAFIYLKVLGIESGIDSAFTLVVGYYFMDKLINKPPTTGGNTT